MKLGLQNKSGTHIIQDYRGISVLSYYSHIGLNEEFNCDFDWVLLSEIDEKEAFEAVDRLGELSIIIGLIIVLLVSAKSKLSQINPLNFNIIKSMI